MQYEDITTDSQLKLFCDKIAGCPWIAFDTEFVSEHTYRPVLCLVQVAAGDHLAVIDAMAIDDITPFWELLGAEGHETIVHAGRSELEFCFQAIGRSPANLYDVQIAAGLIGVEYPAAYGTLIVKLLGEKRPKHETRTDWRRRPLSARQIEYALGDAIYLPRLRDLLNARLEELGRIDWLAEEMTAWQAEVERAQSQQRWRRVSGNSAMDGRSLAVVRELWYWREAEAERRNKPARRVLRDDLIVELAKRCSADPKRIGAVRGLERGDLKRRIPELAQCVERGLEHPEADCPRPVRRRSAPQLAVLGQFLFAALGSVCRRGDLAPNLVGTPNDIRELIAYRTESSEDEDDKKPSLAGGWRAEFVGRLFDDLLAGKTSIRIADAKSDCPLVFEPCGESAR